MTTRIERDNDLLFPGHPVDSRPNIGDCRKALEVLPDPHERLLCQFHAAQVKKLGSSNTTTRVWIPPYPVPLVGRFHGLVLRSSDTRTWGQ